ncbi:MAG: DMT family transporter [Pseudomonadota bacterium]
MTQDSKARYCLLFGGVLWGLYWMPMKQIEGGGLSGTAPALAVFLVAGVLVLPLLVWRWRALAARGWDFVQLGLLAGGALAMFTIALAETEIVRAILLFYLSPVWSTALGLIFLGDRPNAARVTTLTLGLVGLVIVLGVEGGFPWPRNLGDTLALISGMCWSLASLKLFRMDAVPVRDMVAAFFPCCALVTVGLHFGLGGTLPREAVAGAAPWVLFAALYIMPTLTMTLWPASVLVPAKAGLLLMTEVVVGTLSAALLSGEPFGLRDVLGCLLITGALVAEVIMPTPNVKTHRSDHAAQ